MDIPTEHQEQLKLVHWANAQKKMYPALALLYAIPNGGHRHPVTAARLKAEGVKPGVPDLHLPVARGGYHGLYIEMKRIQGGRLSPEQRRWKADLEAQGHKVAVCKGAMEAWEVITEYLG